MKITHKDALPRDMLGRKGLVLVDTALKIITAHLTNHKPKTETIQLDQALDRITAEAINAPEDLPQHTRSTMDGYAVRAADTFGASQSMPCYLEIAGEVFMGKAPNSQVKQGTCFKIATGGLLPEGADAVVMLEHTVPVDKSMIELVKSAGQGANLIKKGEDIQKECPALEAGHHIRPQDLGLLAGLGISKLSVFTKVKVGIIATGDEIVPFNQTPEPGEIRNINSITLSGQLKRCDTLITDYGIVSDKKESFLSTIKQAISENDLVLFSGGSSVGIRDLGEQIIEELGNPGILVHGVALKPGKPIIIGLTDTTPIFGLPGHPVSAMVCFAFFVKPTIDMLAGQKSQNPSPNPSVIATLTRNINSASGRRDLIRVHLEHDNDKWLAHPVLGKSGSITTISRAHGFFLIEENSQGTSENSEVEVYLLT